jgi:hypothetical protein
MTSPGGSRHHARDAGLAGSIAIAAIMDQVNLAFVPDVLVIPLHSKVLFPNSDAISHRFIPIRLPTSSTRSCIPAPAPRPSCSTRPE